MEQIMVRNTAKSFEKRSERLSRLSAQIADMASDANSNPAMREAATHLEQAAALLSQASDAYHREA